MPHARRQQDRSRRHRSRRRWSKRLRDEFGTECLPINLPAQTAASASSTVSSSRAARADFSSVAEAHQHIIDQVVEINETVMGHYLDDGESGLSGQELHDAFEQCLREGHLVPICFASGAHRRRRQGTAGSSPRSCCRIRRKAIRRRSSRAAARTRSRSRPQPDPKKHVIADVFKIVNDPFVGKLSVFRVYQGTVSKDTQLFIDDGKKPFKVGHLFKLQGQGSRRDRRRRFRATSPRSRRSRKSISTRCCTIRTTRTRSTCKPLDFPLPMFGLAVEPRAQGPGAEARDRAAQARRGGPVLPRRAQQGTQRDRRSAGLSDLHLKLMLERMKERYGVEVKTRPPRIAYRETIAAQRRRPSPPQEADRRRRPVRRGVPAHRAAAARRAASSSSTRSRAARFPGQFIPAVEKGVRQVLEHGAVAGLSSCRTCA